MQNINEYLTANGYASVEEWAADSNYESVSGSWFDEHGNEVDLVSQLHAALGIG